MSNYPEKMAVTALAQNVINTRFEDIDKDTIENTKNRILDVIGCAIGGANAPRNSALVDMIKDWGGKKESTIIAHGLKAPAPEAAWANAILMPFLRLGAAGYHCRR